MFGIDAFRASASARRTGRTKLSLWRRAPCTYKDREDINDSNARTPALQGHAVHTSASTRAARMEAGI